MHICLICYEYPPAIHGGVGTFTRDLAEGLVSRGITVTVVGVYDQNILPLSREIEENRNGVRVVRIPSASFLPNRVRMLWDRMRLTNWLRLRHFQTPFDIIEAPESVGWLAFGSPKGVPTVARFHGSQILFGHMLQRKTSKSFAFFEKRWIKRANFWVGDTEYALAQTAKLARLPIRTHQVIYNAVDTERFSPGDAKFNLRKKHVVFANSIHPRKGVKELAVAMELVLRKHPDAHLTFVGKDIMFMSDNRPLSQHILDAIDVNTRSHITFTGWLETPDEVVEYLRGASVCCYPSHAEGFGIAPVEAMSVGKPTIFMRHGPGPEVIEDGVSGLLCNTSDPKDIARCIIALFEDNRLAKSLGEEARKRVLIRFDKKTWIDRNIDYYKHCVSEYKYKRDGKK